MKASRISRSSLDALRHRLLVTQRRLCAELDEVETDLRLLEEDRESGVGDRAQEAARARLLSRLDDRERQELAEVHRALAKIASDAYGICESCAAAMPRERLEAVPAARLCLDCQRAAETRAG